MLIMLEWLNTLWKTGNKTGYYTAMKMKELELSQMTWRDFPQVEWIKKTYKKD